MYTFEPIGNFGQTNSHEFVPKPSDIIHDQILKQFMDTSTRTLTKLKENILSEPQE